MVGGWSMTLFYPHYGFYRMKNDIECDVHKISIVFTRKRRQNKRGTQTVLTCVISFLFSCWISATFPCRMLKPFLAASHAILISPPTTCPKPLSMQNLLNMCFSFYVTTSHYPQLPLFVTSDTLWFSHSYGQSPSLKSKSPIK